MTIQRMTFCITAVDVRGDLTMQFNVTWTAELEECKNYVLQPDLDNHRLYLEDDLENAYRHTGSGGCAAERKVFVPPTDDCTGWFLFPPAKSSARAFRFIDSNNWVSVENIVLGPREPA